MPCHKLFLNLQWVVPQELKSLNSYNHKIILDLQTKSHQSLFQWNPVQPILKKIRPDRIHLNFTHDFWKKMQYVDSNQQSKVGKYSVLPLGHRVLILDGSTFVLFLFAPFKQLDWSQRSTKATYGVWSEPIKKEVKWQRLVLIGHPLKFFLLRAEEK